MKLNLEPKDIQIILDVLAREEYFQAVLTRKKIVEQIFKSPKVKRLA